MKKLLWRHPGDCAGNITRTSRCASESAEPAAALLRNAGLAHRVTDTGAELIREWDAGAKPLEGENIFVGDRG